MCLFVPDTMCNPVSFRGFSAVTLASAEGDAAAIKCSRSRRGRREAIGHRSYSNQTRLSPFTAVASPNTQCLQSASPVGFVEDSHHSFLSLNLD